MDNEVKKTGVVEKTPPTWAERVLKKSGVALLEATCLGCGARLKSGYYWKNYSEVGQCRIACKRENNNPRPTSLFCKRCTRGLYNKYLIQYNGDIYKAMFAVCMCTLSYYDEDVVTQCINNLYSSDETRHFLTDLPPKIPDTEEYNYSYNCEEFVFDGFPDCYLRIIGNPRDKQYVNVDLIEQFNQRGFKEATECLKLSASEAVLSEEDKKNRADIIAIFLKDPYENEPIYKKPELYRNLSLMIDSTLANDLVRQKAALNIVNSFIKIEEYDRAIAQFTGSPESIAEHAAEIKALNELKRAEQQMEQNLAKDNGFSERYATAKAKGSGTLSGAMREMDNSFLDDARANCYDINTCAAMTQAAEISAKAIVAQLGLTADETTKLLIEQRKLLDTAIKEKEEVVEAFRLLKEKIAKQEILEELKQELKQKNISASEINDLLLMELDESILEKIPKKSTSSETKSENTPSKKKKPQFEDEEEEEEPENMPEIEGYA